VVRSWLYHQCGTHELLGPDATRPEFGALDGLLPVPQTVREMEATGAFEGDTGRTNHCPVGSQAKFCLFSETPDFRVLRPSPPARPILRGAQRNFPNRRSGADWGQALTSSAGVTQNCVASTRAKQLRRTSIGRNVRRFWHTLEIPVPGPDWTASDARGHEMIEPRYDCFESSSCSARSDVAVYGLSPSVASPRRLRWLSRPLCLDLTLLAMFANALAFVLLIPSEILPPVPTFAQSDPPLGLPPPSRCCFPAPAAPAPPAVSTAWRTFAASSSRAPDTCTDMRGEIMGLITIRTG
jgi:hypothetical protein